MSAPTNEACIKVVDTQLSLRSLLDDVALRVTLELNWGSPEARLACEISSPRPS